MVKANKPKYNRKAGALSHSPSNAILEYFEEAEKHFSESNFHHAKTIYSEIISADKHFIPALRQLGLCELQLDSLPGAIKLLGKYIKSAPDDQLAQAKLAQAYLMDGKPAKAKHRVARAIRIGATPDLHFLAAAVDENLAEPLNALAHYKRGLALDPERLSAKLAVGLIYKNLPEYDCAISAFKEILSAQPDHANALSNLGGVYHTLGLFEEAIACYQNAQSLAASADISYNEGLSYQQLMQAEKSVIAFKVALSIEPEHLAAKIQLAEAYSSQGLFVESEQTLEQVVCQDNDNFHVWFLKTQSKKFAQENTNTETKLLSLKKLAKTPEEKCLVYFALGKIYDDTSRYELAFQHFDIANRQRFKFVKPLAQQQINLLNPRDGSGMLSSAEPTEAKQAFEKQTPIFIIGMPRSGTTLLERVIVEAPGISSCGELDYFGPALFRRASGIGEFNNNPNAGALTATEMHILREGYLNRVSSICQDASIFVDKTPDNFAYLPLLARLFPQAPILHCQRHPLDTCLSIYFQLFQDLPYSYDLNTIAAYYSKYRECIEFYRPHHADRWLDINYEDLVQHPVETTLELSEYLHCDIAQLRQSESRPSQAIINTMSKWQARQGIYQHAINRWQHYEAHLGGLIEKLSNFLPR